MAVHGDANGESVVVSPSTSVDDRICQEGSRRLAARLVYGAYTHTREVSVCLHQNEKGISQLGCGMREIKQSEASRSAFADVSRRSANK